VVAFLWLRLAALRLCTSLCFPGRSDFSAKNRLFGEKEFASY
jgi:hypothetical protein